MWSQFFSWPASFLSSSVLYLAVYSESFLCLSPFSNTPSPKQRTFFSGLPIDFQVDLLLSLSSYYHTTGQSIERQVVGSRNGKFIWKAADLENGGLVSQRIMLPELVTNSYYLNFSDL